ncbi:glycosyltransferase family 1 protein [uncultured Erythrobacter sp.]|uniref:glycosyltransferase family 4 protein n=1 Tax=uncultured Erythrobacter sp. TaxID=263913 RepID=UPI00262EB4C5|nr:glycosyltransferase family 1 protein [uncultured Erythrobacter sp.]
MKRILIDGYNLAMAKGTGIATYARNLCEEVSGLGHEVSVLYGERIAEDDDPLLREISFFDPIELPKGKLRRIARAIRSGARSPFDLTPRELDLSGSVVPNAFAGRFPTCKRIFNGEDLFHRANAGFAIGRGFSKVYMPGTVDLAHWTYPLPIEVKGAPNIYTMHDLVPLRLPYTTLDNKRAYLKLVRQIASRADHIVTVSECSKRDIMELLDVPEDRVTNTYQSVELPEDALKFSDEEVARIVEGGFDVGYKDYFLFWGSIEPKKNLHRMIEGYLASGVETPLVIVGARAWRSEEELRLVKDSGKHGKSRIIQLSYCPQGTLINLIRGAKAALFPSLYEGFGLPALEAMTLGTPVIGSNTGSLPEVIGDAGLQVDPYHSKAIAQAFSQMDSDSGLRNELTVRGATRAELFSPSAHRKRLDALYGRLL